MAWEVTEEVLANLVKAKNGSPNRIAAVRHPLAPYNPNSRGLLFFKRLNRLSILLLNIGF
jgi:hypothetical protein